MSCPAEAGCKDAVSAAGGLKRGADTSNINLAAFLADGQYLAVPFIIMDLIIPSPAVGAPAVNDPQQGSSRSVGIDIGAPININTATQEELETLPGIGPVIAQRIIEYRQTNGNFQTIEDIQKVPGIGAKTFEKMQAMITTGSP